MKKTKVAILGSGKIGTDLLIKVLHSPYLECAVFLGRHSFSSGMLKAQSLGVYTSADSIGYLENHPDCCDIVFDATSAQSHLMHAPILKRLNKFTIDLTPAKVGAMCVPVVNKEEALNAQNINMITCGGQAAIPLAYVIAKTHTSVEYIEVISSIASESAGPATRANMDEYIHTTEQGLAYFSGAKIAKAILNLNPAEPCINMQTTVFAKVAQPNVEKLTQEINTIVTELQYYVPGYQILLGPMLENNRITVMIRVKGRGDYLPAYAGNLDIINCAAIAMAEAYTKKQAQLFMQAAIE